MIKRCFLTLLLWSMTILTGCYINVDNNEEGMWKEINKVKKDNAELRRELDALRQDQGLTRTEQGATVY